MGMIAEIFRQTAQTPMAPPPIHERLAAELRDAERELPDLAERHAAANFDHLAGPQSPETAAALQSATTALADGRAHVEALKSALQVATERAAVRAERERAARFVKSQKTLGAHLVTRDRQMRKAAGHLESYVLAWHAAIVATGQIQTALGDLGLKQPLGAMLSVREMREVIETEIHRLNSVQDPLRASQVGYALTPPGAQSHDLSTKFNGRSLHAIGAVLKEKTEYLLRWFAGRETMVANPVTVSVPRLPSVVPEPTAQVKAADIPNLAAMAAEYAADQSPPAWDAGSLEAQQAEWASLQHPADRLDPDSYDEGEPAEAGLSPLHELVSPDLKETTDVE